MCACLLRQSAQRARSEARREALRHRGRPRRACGEAGGCLRRSSPACRAPGSRRTAARWRVRMTCARHATPQTSSYSSEPFCVPVRLRTSCRYAVYMYTHQTIIGARCRWRRDFAGTLTHRSSKSVCLPETTCMSQGNFRAIARAGGGRPGLTEGQGAGTARIPPSR